MIYKTENRKQFVDCINGLKAKGYTQITNAIVPNWIAGDNYIQVDSLIACFSLCSEELAEKVGFVPYEN